MTRVFNWFKWILVSLTVVDCVKVVAKLGNSNSNPANAAETISDTIDMGDNSREKNRQNYFDYASKKPASLLDSGKLQDTAVKRMIKSGQGFHGSKYFQPAGRHIRRINEKSGVANAKSMFKAKPKSMFKAESESMSRSEGGGGDLGTIGALGVAALGGYAGGGAGAKMGAAVGQSIGSSIGFGNQRKSSIRRRIPLGAYAGGRVGAKERASVGQSIGSSIGFGSSSGRGNEGGDLGVIGAIAGSALGGHAGGRAGAKERASVGQSIGSSIGFGWSHQIA